MRHNPNAKTPDEKIDPLFEEWMRTGICLDKLAEKSFISRTTISNAFSQKLKQRKNESQNPTTSK